MSDADAATERTVEVVTVEVAPASTPSIFAATVRDYVGLSRDFGSSLLLDATTADVNLSVQNTILPAHRAILSARSPVFRAMFYGAMKEKGSVEVEINHFALAEMRLLLCFIYSGNVQEVSLKDMVPLMACADHYGVCSLRDALHEHLCESISAETACLVLASAQIFLQESIVDRCLSFILAHAQHVVQTESFLSLDGGLLMKVLEADETRIEEIDLFKALVRWYLHWRSEPEVRLADIQVEKLFSLVRYGHMSGHQLVTEVKPLVGDVVPRELYVRALEHVAAPGTNCSDEEENIQCRRRKPLNCVIQISDVLFMTVVGTVVRKIGPAGWNCSAVVEPQTSCTRITVEHLAHPPSGIGIAMFDPDRRAFRNGNCGFPNPNQWGSDCIVGLYGTGCFFGINSDRGIAWHVGMKVEVIVGEAEGTGLPVAFSVEGATGEHIIVQGVVPVPTGVKLAVALYSPEDQVTVESAW
eukprot:TRINITY_DN42174_c0_g1_i1.p1 TRINITY_DN42174_c0_g1~~TRINITY_DN42174_c0_g1_i1.p1  ORF type:complete len:483 (+),score=63.99 TRINITY_DN42174_c0_g1_i1:37-1449(+)